MIHKVEDDFLEFKRTKIDIKIPDDFPEQSIKNITNDSSFNLQKLVQMLNQNQMDIKKNQSKIVTNQQILEMKI